MGPILYLSHRGAAAGGGEESLLDLLAALGPRIAPLAVLGEAGELAKRLGQAGVPVTVLPFPGRRSLRFLARRRTIAALARLCRERQVALLHANTAPTLGFALAAGRRAEAPVVWHLRSAGNFPRRLVRQARGCAAVLAISEWLAGRAQAAGVPRERLCVVPNGIDLARFAAPPPAAVAAVRAELGAGAPGLFLAGLVARLDPVKDHPTFLRAAARLRDEPRCRFAVVGEAGEGRAAYAAGLPALASALGLAGRVVFAGRRTDIPAVTAALDAAVQPSLAEGLGRAALEAQAAGRPVVCARAGGLPEAVAEGETALCFAPGDDAELAAHLRRLADEPELARRLGEAGRARAAALFSRERLAGEVLGVYAKIARAAGAVSSAS